jgi:hypothetical protein
MCRVFRIQRVEADLFHPFYQVKAAMITLITPKNSMATLRAGKKTNSMAPATTAPSKYWCVRNKENTI